MIKFRRNTHDRDGKFRKWMDNPIVEKISNICTCCVHMLDSNRWMTLDEIVAEHQKYDKDFDMEGFNWSPQEILTGLASLVYYGIVEMEERSDDNES